MGLGESEVQPASISRLQSRKAEIEKEIESKRASTRFEPETDEEATSGKDRLDNILASELAKTPAPPPKIKRDKLSGEEESTYTSRLLDAKRKAQEKQNRGNLPDDEN
jgi:hypothetical protein